MHKHFTIEGFYHWEEVDEQSGEVINKSPETHNIILNQGIDYIGQFYFSDCFANMAVGNGTIPPLYTDQGLINEMVRTNEVDTHSQTPCGTLLSGDTYYMFRTLRTEVSDSPITFAEIGWSPYPFAGNNLYSKTQLIDSKGLNNPVTIQPGRYLRVKYTMAIKLTTGQATGFFNMSGSLINQDGTLGMQYLGLARVNEDGSTAYFDSGNDCNEPSSICEGFMSESSDPLSSFGSSTDRSASPFFIKETSKYYVGNGIMQKLADFGSIEATGSNFRSFGLGIIGNSEKDSGLVFVFNNPQEKLYDHILRLRFIYSWSRT